MNKILRTLVKKIILGATAALSTNPIFASPKSDGLNLTINSKQSELVLPNFNRESDVPNLVLQSPTQTNSETNLFHASHSSHASHASHASHYSGYNDPNSAPPSDDNSITKSKATDQAEKTKNEMIHALGSRTLRRNMVGTDVAALQDLLKSKGYKVNVTGSFDDPTEKAIRQFQSIQNIKITGEVDVLTLYYLNK